MAGNLIVVLALVCAAAIPRASAENGEGFFAVSASTATRRLNITAVDPNTLMPLPGTFTANDMGEYELSGLIVLDGDTANPIGDFEITGHGDPHLQTKITFLAEDSDSLTGPVLFLQMLAGIDVVVGGSPLGDEWRIESVQTTSMTGSAGTPPFSPNGYTSVFLETEDDKSVNALDAGVGGLLLFPGTTTFESGNVEVPELPPDSMEESFSRLVVQHDLAFFDLSQDTSFTLESTARTEIFLEPPTGIPGDFNNDGKVEAADYIGWRKNVGAPAGTLPNDTAGGEIGADQYDLWVENFGSGPDASGSGAAVPEPEMAFLTLFVSGLLLLRRLHG